MFKLLLFIAAIIALGMFLRREPKVTLPDGIEYVTEDPIQSKADKSMVLYHDAGDEYIMKPLYEYDVKAKVILRKEYKSGIDGKFSPVDFLLGWGALSDEQYSSHKDISFGQSRRWYRFTYQAAYPLSEAYIQQHTSNTHIIPANTYIKEQALNVKEGAIVHLKGYLVNIKRDDGWHWNSSTSRSDSGDGACELFYVESIAIIED